MKKQLKKNENNICRERARREQKINKRGFPQVTGGRVVQVGALERSGKCQRTPLLKHTKLNKCASSMSICMLCTGVRAIPKGYP